jgi:hypothetical protein
MEMEAEGTEVIALSKPLDRAVDSIVWMLVMLVDFKTKPEFLKRCYEFS